MILVGIESTFKNKLIRDPARGGGGSHVAGLNFQKSRVSVYKCLSLIVGFAVTVTIWPREVVSCRDFILVTLSQGLLLVSIFRPLNLKSSYCHKGPELKRICVHKNPSHLINLR